MTNFHALPYEKIMNPPKPACVKGRQGVRDNHPQQNETHVSGDVKHLKDMFRADESRNPKRSLRAAKKGVSSQLFCSQKSENLDQCGSVFLLAHFLKEEWLQYRNLATVDFQVTSSAIRDPLDIHSEICMVDRILREFSYAMNRTDADSPRQEPPADEVPESGYKRLRMRPIPRRVQGEAMSTFNRSRGRKAKNSDLAQTTNPFTVGQKTLARETPKASPAATPRFISIGDQLNLGGRQAILMEIGATKFKVLQVGGDHVESLKLSDFPHFLVRQHKIWVAKEEHAHARV
ncbi:MAG TPA: hypothetical protein VE954_27415 [Oligoflexus sp.]|uniref:hypothetical protein n=1 Tax=Oligoflexus sp. TaxID=1971216 RepID=UPI002D4134F9|nr:hypothetical protein [Oligoflexus sp.]HYX36854.1 hypothetical protein [Oligoflexus sp.]